VIAASIAEALQLNRNGNGWRGPCPVCGGSDKASKFSIRDGDMGGVIVWCFAGCSQQSIIGELKGRNLWPARKSLLPPLAEYSQKKSRAEIEAALSHELVVLDLIVGQRVADRQLARDKRFRDQRPEWRPIPDEHWQREILAAKRIKAALGVLYG
jgi:hypothetical protein